MELTDIHIPSPGPNGVIINIQTYGVCHTDLAYHSGDVTDECPSFLGHETTGVVPEISEEVTHVTVGDFVVLSWHAICGECRACKQGEPQYCFSIFNTSKFMTLAGGIVLTPALRIDIFTDAILTHEGQYTKVDSAIDPAVTDLLSCGTMAGISAAINTGEVKRGESVAVIDYGDVNTAAIAGVRPAGVSKVIAIDIPGEKLDTARKFGAAETINSTELAKSGRGTGGEDPVVKRMHELTDSFGVDAVIDAVGRPETYKQTLYACDLTGYVVSVGVLTPTMELDIPLADVSSHGDALKLSWYGDCLPERDFPMLVDLSLQSRLPLGGFVTEHIGIEDVDEASKAIKADKILRSVVTL